MQSNYTDFQFMTAQPSDLERLKASVSSYVATVDEIDRQARRGEDVSSIWPQPIDLGSLGSIQSQNSYQNHQARYLIGAYSEAAARLAEIQTRITTFNEYHTNLKRASESVQSRLNASKDYIASDGYDPNLIEHRYPDELKHKWMEMSVACEHYDKFAGSFGSLEDYVSPEHPVWTHEAKWGEMSTEWVKEGSGNRDFWKMQSVMASIRDRDLSPLGA